MSGAILSSASKQYRAHAPTLSVAPMMGYTDRWLRYLLRYLSPHSWLYTEMISAGALVRAGAGHRLRHHPSEHPLVLQIGGGEPAQLARAAEVAVEHGHRHLNLNAGCPSDKVRSAGMGVCLLKEPNRLRECARALRVPGVVSTSVKTRIGVDDQDSYEKCLELAAGLLEDGCDFLVLHARKAWLNGLSPSQNRRIPPLNYERVYQLQADLPQMPIIINGGLARWPDCQTALQRCAGVMLGRAVVRDPAGLMDIEERLWGTEKRRLEDIFAHYFSFLMEDETDPALKDRGSWARAIRHIMPLVRATPLAARVRHRIAQAANLQECAGICRLYAQSGH